MNFVPGCYLFCGLIHLLQKLPTPIQNCTQTSVPSPLRCRWNFKLEPSVWPYCTCVLISLHASISFSDNLLTVRLLYRLGLLNFREGRPERKVFFLCLYNLTGAPISSLLNKIAMLLPGRGCGRVLSVTNKRHGRKPTEHPHNRCQLLIFEESVIRWLILILCDDFSAIGAGEGGDHFQRGKRSGVRSGFTKWMLRNVSNFTLLN